MKKKGEFIKAVKEGVAGVLGDSVIVRNIAVPVNNGKRAEALEFKRKDKSEGINLKLEAYYEEYCEGRELDMIVKDICGCYAGISADFNNYAKDMESMRGDFEKVRNNIVFRLVNASMNKDSLGNVPYIKALDLALVFYVSLSGSKNCFCSSVVTCDQLKKWGVTKSELLKVALKNAPVLFPPSLKKADDIMMEIEIQLGMEAKLAEEFLKTAVPQEGRTPMYVLSNIFRMNGAAVILYPNELKRVSDIIGGNLVILPSSIHETILVPESEETDLTFLKELVKEVNKTEVESVDWLADNVYLYDREQDSIKMAGQDGTDSTAVFRMAELESIVAEGASDEAV